jgi:hypothetical protein
MSEHDEQAAFVEWCQRMTPQYPELEYGFAIPNGGKRSIGTARKLKAEGVKAGVLDWHLPIKRGAYIGLWIEFKFGHNVMTPEQERWAEWLYRHGHRVEIAYEWEAAADIALEYLGLDDDAIPF